MGETRSLLGGTMQKLLGAASAALFGTALSLLSGCAAEAGPEETSSSSSEIVNGWDDYRHPAVVMLAAKDKDGNYGGFCTGTLVRANKVLTAAHCVVGGAPAQDTIVMFGRDKDSPVGLVQVASIAAHPGYSEGNNFPNDAGVVTLAGNVTGVKPMPMLRDPVPAKVALVTHVGFGHDFSNTKEDAEGFGKKRVLVQPLLQIDATKLITGQALCYGDSGGPAIMRVIGVETVVGIHSFFTSSCNDPENLGASQRLDVVADFISKHVN
jgi:secreted trypsin-like serine protease